MPWKKSKFTEKQGAKTDVQEKQNQAGAAAH